MRPACTSLAPSSNSRESWSLIADSHVPPSLRMDADGRLIVLAEAVADGVLPDWERESAAASDDERAAIRQLQLIALAARQNAEQAMQITLSLRSAQAEKQGLAADADAPVTWGPLTIHEKIGSGRFGDVYRATDPGL